MSHQSNEHSAKQQAQEPQIKQEPRIKGKFFSSCQRIVQELMEELCPRIIIIQIHAAGHQPQKISRWKQRLVLETSRNQ